MAKSSINFQPSKFNWEHHMFRTSKVEPSYLLDQTDRKQNEYWHMEGVTDQQLFEQEMSQIKGKGKRPIFENCLVDGVLNLEKKHTLEDVQKVAKLCEKTLGIKCTAIALHRDEGYKDDLGEVHYNYHAHLHFFTLQNGKQSWRQVLIRPKLKELQTKTAKSLGMERGSFGSKAQRLEHKQYKAVMKEKEQLLKEVEQIDKLKEQLAKAEQPSLLNSFKNFLNKEPKKEIEVVTKMMSSAEIKRTDTYQDLLQKNTVFHNALKTAKERIDNLTSELADKNQEIEKLKLQLKSLEEQKKQWIAENQKAKEQSQPQVHSQDDYKPLNAQIREVKAEIKQAEKPIEKPKPKDTMPLEFLLRSGVMPDVVMNVKRTFPHVSDFNQVKTWCWQYVMGHADEEFPSGKDIDETILKGSLYVTKQIRQKILQSTSIPSDNTLLQKMLGHPLETQQNSNLSTSNDRVEQSDDITVGKSVHRSR